MVYVILLFVMFTTNLILKLPRHIFEVSTREKAVGIFQKTPIFNARDLGNQAPPKGAPHRKSHRIGKTYTMV